MKARKKTTSAYMTVEVSLLFPIILMILVCIIYIIFYSYNEAIAFQNAAIAALYGKSCSNSEKKEIELVDNVYTTLERLNNNQYIALANFKQAVSVEMNNIKIVQTGSVKMPLLNEEMVSEMSFSENINVNLQNAIFYIRQIRKVKQDEN